MVIISEFIERTFPPDRVIYVLNIYYFQGRIPSRVRRRNNGLFA